MKIGFTGTQRGLTEYQTEELTIYLRMNRAEIAEFHHGDCVGADSDAHDVVESVGVPIWIHPPSDPKKRAFRVSAHIRLQRPYLERNRAIVDATDVLIAAPKSTVEELRSGTWSTIRYARKVGRKVIILKP